MPKLLSAFVLTALAACVLASPIAEPAVTQAPDANLAKRATSCTFSGSNGAASASASQKSCSTIVLSSVAVPSGTTLDLSDLEDDTTVRPKNYAFHYVILYYFLSAFLSTPISFVGCAK